MAAMIEKQQKQVNRVKGGKSMKDEYGRQKQCYVGGGLFTDKQITQRLQEGAELRRLGYNVYNPIENDKINDKTKKPTARDIFRQDTKEILASHAFLADLDDGGTGLSMELGIIYMSNYMREELITLLSVEDKDKQIRELLKKLPEKEVYATCSDIRQDTENEQGIYKSWGQNMFVIGGIEHVGKIYRHFEDVVDTMEED